MRKYTVNLGSKRATGTRLEITVRTPSDPSDGCSPRFSVTAVEYAKGRDVASGQMHEAILMVRPDLADVVALRLSDAEGAPMHAFENGWYWLTGACGGLGEQYHGGTGMRADVDAPSECRRILGEHLRVSYATVADMINTTLTIARQESVAAAKANFKQWVDDLRPTWAAQAEAAEAKYGNSTNREGLTYSEWCDATGGKSQDASEWRAGVDPSEYRK